MGGAMDLVGTGKSRVIVLTTHTNKNGAPKILPVCTLPLTGYRVVDTIITEQAVFKVDKREGLTLIEIADNVKIADLTKNTGCEFKVKIIFFLLYFILIFIFQSFIFLI
jgi:3-oxoacid CoA-transferase B subunit